MSMKPNLEGTGNVIKGVAAIIALFPGIAVLLGLVTIPPSLSDMVKVISFSVSGIVLIAVFLMSERIARLSKERVALFSIVAVLLGAGSLIGYFSFATTHTVIVEKDDGGTETFIVPLSPPAELRDAVDSMNGSYKVVLQMAPQREDLKDLMRKNGTSSMSIMLLLLVLSQILLIAPVVAAAWRLAGAPGSAAAAEDKAKAPAQDSPDDT